MKYRYALGSAAILALLLAGGAVHNNVEREEGFVAVANVPVKGDPCTGGSGSTTHSDGSKVKCGDVFTKEYAIRRVTEYLLTQHTQLNDCIHVPLTTVEYAMIADHGYQYGVGSTCKSSIVRLANREDYRGSCDAYLEYKKLKRPKYLGEGWTPVKGRPSWYEFDCSTPGNKVCTGVWKRSLHRYNACMSEQQNEVLP